MKLALILAFSWSACALPAHAQDDRYDPREECRSALETSPALSSLAGHLKLPEAVVSEVLSRFFTSSIWRTAEALVLYGSRTHHWWERNGDLDVGFFMPERARLKAPGDERQRLKEELGFHSRVSSPGLPKGLRLDLLSYWNTLSLDEWLSSRFLSSVQKLDELRASVQAQSDRQHALETQKQQLLVALAHDRIEFEEYQRSYHEIKGALDLEILRGNPFTIRSITNFSPTNDDYLDAYQLAVYQAWQRLHGGHDRPEGSIPFHTLDTVLIFNGVPSERSLRILRKQGYRQLYFWTPTTGLVLNPPHQY